MVACCITTIIAPNAKPAIVTEGNMKAQDIKTGDTLTYLNWGRKVMGGWTATGDAVVEGNQVYVPAKDFTGSEGTHIFKLDEEVPID
jgi:hypothetical protein